MATRNLEFSASQLSTSLFDFFKNSNKLSCLEPDGSGTHTLLPIRSGNEVTGYKYQFEINRTKQITMAIDLDLQLCVSQIVRPQQTSNKNTALSNLVLEIIREMLLQNETSARVDTPDRAVSKDIVSLNRHIIATLIANSTVLLVAIDDDTFEMSDAAENNLVEQIGSIFVGHEGPVQWNILVPHKFCISQIHPLYHVKMHFTHNSLVLTIQALISLQSPIPGAEIFEYNIIPDRTVRTSPIPLSQGSVVCLRAICRKLGFLNVSA